MKRSFAIAAALAPAVLAPTTAFANSSTELEQLSQQLAAQQRQIEALQQQLQPQLKPQIEALSETPASADPRFSFSSYGNVVLDNRVIYQNSQDSEGDRRTSADLERVVVEFGYQFSDRWSAEAEIEFEHGGTGVTLEYDGFDEFGEFETEVEAGGEVIVEQAKVAYQYAPWLTLQLGRFYVPVGMTTMLHKPNQYFTVRRHGDQGQIIPTVWHETGLGLKGNWHNFFYQAQLITGLNSEYFRTYGWVATGHQRRFETVNADDLAMVLRLDWGDIKTGSALGLAYYQGNTSGNRHKTNKIDADGQVRIWDLHGAYVEGPWTLRGQYLYGELDDADLITQANKTTPGLNPGNFAQLGSESEFGFIEAGVNVAPWLGWSQPLSLFINGEYSNPQKAVQSGTGTARFERSWLSTGINYQPVTQVVLKAEFGQERVEQNNIDDSTFFALSAGYQFSL
ncbi:hypothetical protein [uncultured Ferrimonas sp.]|uniref:hypothetical protein n=1 Tax=uncultured Ferrimonas sp. TaxID=432640 RepID=UPI002622099E|nr:hypothetical protein [uncultured Ferrimonas sp.]